MNCDHVLCVAETLRKAKSGDEPIFVDVHGTPALEPEMPAMTVVCSLQGRVERRTFRLKTSVRARPPSHGSSDPVLHVPIGFNPERLVKKVLALFDHVRS